jgi:hypothetical protein
MSIWVYDPTQLSITPGLTIAELVHLIRNTNNNITSLRLSGKKEQTMVLAIVRGDEAQKLEQFMQELEG